MLPLVEFKGTTIFKAFLLNALTSALVIVLAIEVNVYLRTRTDEDEDETKSNNHVNVLMVLGVTFATTFIAYVVMFALFGFGEAMTVNN